MRHKSGNKGKNVSPSNQDSTIQEKLQNMVNALPQRSDLHLKRKLWHATTGSIFVLFYAFGPDRTAMSLIVMGLFVVILSGELLRLRFPTINEKIIKIFGGVIRSHEVDRVTGTPYYVGAVGVAIALFPEPVAILSILYLAWGDPISSLFGVLYGKEKLFRNKSVQGTMACFIVCTCMSLFYFSISGIAPGRVVLFSLLGGMVAAVAEILPLNIDDNFSIPMISGFFMWLLFIAAGIPV